MSPNMDDIVIRGRTARHVDFLENVIFLGRLQFLWESLTEAARLRKGERVLDVGCGTGQIVLLACEEAGPDAVFGLDASGEMIQIAAARGKAAGKQVHFLVGRMESLPFANDAFDVVLSSQALHHVPTERKMASLAEMLRVLKPGDGVWLSAATLYISFMGQLCRQSGQSRGLS